jgi:hypothetical protein
MQMITFFLRESAVDLRHYIAKVFCRRYEKANDLSPDIEG